MTLAPELTPRQTRAIAALLTCDTREASAKAAGVSVRTLQRWINLPGFAAELGRQRSKLLDATATELIRGSASCARALVDIANGRTRASAPRVAAARAVVDLAHRFDERAEYLERFEALEELVNRQKGSLQ
jgi:phage terminase small subunit